MTKQFEGQANTQLSPERLSARVEELRRGISPESTEAQQLVEPTRQALSELYGPSPEDFEPVNWTDETGRQRLTIILADPEGIKEPFGRDERDDFLRKRLVMEGARVDPLKGMTKELYPAFIEHERARGADLAAGRGYRTTLSGEHKEPGIAFNSGAVYKDEVITLPGPEKYRPAIDVSDLYVAIEKARINPEQLPGGSKETAVLLSPEQTEALIKASKIAHSRSIHPSYRTPEQAELAEMDFEPDPLIMKASDDLSFIDQFGSNIDVWVRSAEIIPEKYVPVHNTWRIFVGNPFGETTYGSSRSPLYMTHPDGSVEEVWRFQPLRSAS